jgi:hypothetical protein
MPWSRKSGWFRGTAFVKALKKKINETPEGRAFREIGNQACGCLDADFCSRLMQKNVSGVPADSDQLAPFHLLRLFRRISRMKETSQSLPVTRRLGLLATSVPASTGLAFRNRN